MEYKRELRKKMKAKRNEIPEEIRKRYDNDIFNKLITKEAYLKAKVLFVYVSYEKEVNTHNIINRALSDGKTVCVPKVMSKELGMLAIKIKDVNELTVGAYGILEPSKTEDVVAAEEIDIIILPGLAFDIAGGRLGYGGGFYDKYLVKIRKDVPKIALGYDVQIIAKVPTEEFDVLTDEVITN